MPPLHPSPAPAAADGWSTISVAGHPCTLYTPPRPLPGRALIYLHGLDGGDDRSPPASAGLRAALEAAGLPTLAPCTGRSWWLDRIMPAFDATRTPERFVIEPVRAEIASRFGVGPPGIALIGTGMGGQGALRIAYRHPGLFPVAAAVAPAIDYHLAMRDCDIRQDGALYDTLWETYADVERARQDTAILHVHPLNWPRHQWFASEPDDVAWHDGAVRLASKLRALGIPHTALLERTSPAAGGRVATAAAADRHVAAVRFVLDALDQESRRLS
ncbi:MAG: esterase [Planctomycetia bacterium]|nr:esterase [Planctomycetia bacterium]